MDLAVKFNDIGCAYYQEGCTEHAYDLFCGAMQALHHAAESNCSLDEMDGISRQMLLVDPSIQRAFDKIDATPNHRHRFRASFQSSHPNTHCPKECGHNHKQTLETDVPMDISAAEALSTSRMDDFVFQWKRVFSVDGLQHYSYTPTVYTSVLSASILFNQAVVLHTGGVPTSRRSLERALTMYSMAAKRLFDYCPRDSLMADEFTMTLTCAVLNNTGYLLHQMGEHGGSQLCFARMNEFLHQLPPSLSLQEKRRRDEFGLNILIFWRPLSGAAAA